MNNTFSTQAGNFISALQTRTDPRTGQFMVNLPLASLAGNNQLGPELALGLSCSPLISRNAGLGTGFALGTTQFSNLTNLLQLSNCEMYRTEPGTDTVRNKKLSNFRFAYTNGTDDGDGYTVYWKEGRQELLTRCGDNTFVTSLITSPMGRTLTLAWDWSGQYSLLTRVSDETVTLCEISYDSTTVMTFWPGTDDESQVTFEFINDTYLDTVSRQVSGGETLSWSFSYDAVEGADHLLLTGVTYPTGMTERVEYSQIDGLQFPDGAGISTRLPAVLSHTRSPGGGQPETVIYYSYTEQNFLGYNGDFGDWSADSDYLYTTLTDYVYGSTECMSDGDVIVTTERKYNNYHLQVSEENTRGGCTYKTDFTYYAEQGCFIESQPPQFLLVKQKTETWTDATGNTRTQTTLTEFDEDGNPTRQVSPDGTETLTAWYAAEGEGDDCPAEPNGFVRFMKSNTVTPRATDYDAPVMQTRYTYMTAGDDTHIVQGTVSTYADDILLLKRQYTYNTASGNPEYGRITTVTDTKYDAGEGSGSYVNRQDFTTSVSDGVMSQTAVFTGHDGLQAASTRVQSALTGLLLSKTDAQGVMVTYTWDRVGRPLTRTAAAGTRNANTTTWKYAIEDGRPVTTESDASGNQMRTYFDGAGRAVRHLRLDRDNTQKWYEVSSRTYNAIGEMSSGTGSDWLTGVAEQYSVSMETASDAWGCLSRQAFSDGITNQQDTNPVALTAAFSVQGENTTGSMLSGTFTTVFDEESRLPLTETRTDTSGRVAGVLHSKWDGQGHLRQETDELSNITVRSYDAYGRVLTQTLPDGSTVIRRYAPHLTGSSVASISVTGPDRDGNIQTWSLGTQTFDSLGRLTSRTSGGRTTMYAWEGASPVPSTVILPSGNMIKYEYIPELGNVTASRTADGVTQTFTYDSLTADLLSAEEGSTESRNIWTPSGSLKTETFSQGDTVREASYTRTLSGKVAAYTDITAKSAWYDRDDFGRVCGIRDEDLTVSLKYDALGRLSEQVVTDIRNKGTLATVLTRDDFGREITRTLTDSSGDTLTVSQSWLPNGLLETRSTQRNDSPVKDEQYDYDVRNRLIRYKVTGDALPEDAYGHKMTSQTYCYDALNNLTVVTTTLKNGSSDTATYHYKNGDDPTQLTSLTHTHSGYPRTITLEYDAGGRMTKDEAGRTLSYDATGRLSGVSGDSTDGGSYGYSALNRLVSQSISDGDTRQLYYRGNELVNEVQTEKNSETRLIKYGPACLGVSNDSRLTLTAGDGNDSLLWSRGGSQKKGNQHSWSPYGNGKATEGLPGFNGERADPVSGTYHLGNGYRAYNPVLMRFNCPDSLSPFGAGGINPYAYCAGDPVNHTDPSGHMSWQNIVGIVAGTVGLALSVFTAGASVAAAGGVMAALSAASATSLVVGGLGGVSDVTAIASGAVAESNPQASSVLGWVSMVTGLAGLGAGVTGLAKVGRGAVRSVADAGDAMEMSHIGRMSAGTGILELPPEIIRKIGDNLLLKDLESFRLADKQFFEAINDNDIAKRFDLMRAVESYPFPMTENEYYAAQNFPEAERLIRIDRYKQLNGVDNEYLDAYSRLREDISLKHRNVDKYIKAIRKQIQFGNRDRNIPNDFNIYQFLVMR